MTNPIFHITERQSWEKTRRDGVYRAPSLDVQGFIHFSKRDQVIGVANAFYRNQTDLVLLVVDPAKLSADLRYEAPDGLLAGEPESSERFPHLYGALNLDAVVRAVDFPPDMDGEWRSLPRAVDGN